MHRHAGAARGAGRLIGATLQASQGSGEIYQIDGFNTDEEGQEPEIIPGTGRDEPNQLKSRRPIATANTGTGDAARPTARLTVGGPRSDH